MNTIYLCLLIFTLLLFTLPAFAQEDNFSEARVNPASPLYFLKSVREILELKSAGTTHIRSIKQLEFATRRIREVRSLAKTSRQDLIAPTLARYWFHLQEFNSLVNLQDQAVSADATSTLSGHMLVLQILYHQVSDPQALRSIRTTIHKLSQWDALFIDKLTVGQPALAQQLAASILSVCNFLSREASSSALNEVERVVLLERAQKCFNLKP